MTGIKILGTGRFLPRQAVSNDNFATIVETSDEWISTRTGMSRRYFSDAGEPAWHIGAKAAEAALEAASLAAGDIDMIIVTTATPDYLIPSTACLIQLALGAENAFAFDMSVACAGFAYALDMARRYLAVGDVRNILIVSTEVLTQITNYGDRSTCVLFGDGAGACVVTEADKRFASYLKSDANCAQLIYAKRPPAQVPFIDNNASEASVPFPTVEDGWIHMAGNDVYKVATKIMPEAIEKACERLGITPSQLSLVIPHQANARIIKTAVKNLGLPPEKFYVNIEKYGNTSSASIAIGLDECVREGKIKSGDLVCVVGFGAGMVYGASIFEY